MNRNFLTETKEEKDLLEGLLGFNDLYYKLQLITYLDYTSPYQATMSNLMFTGSNATLKEYQELYTWLKNDNENRYHDFDYASLLYILYLKYELNALQLLYIMLSDGVKYTFQNPNQPDQYYDTIYTNANEEKSMSDSLTVKDCLDIIETLTMSDEKKHTNLIEFEVIEAGIKKAQAVEDYISFRKMDTEGAFENDMIKTVEFAEIMRTIWTLLKSKALHNLPLQVLAYAPNYL